MRRSPSWRSAAWRGVQQFFVTLDERLADRDFVAGERFSIADITAVVAVDFARVVKVKPGEAHPHLRALAGGDGRAAVDVALARRNSATPRSPPGPWRTASPVAVAQSGCIRAHTLPCSTSASSA